MSLVWLHVSVLCRTLDYLRLPIIVFINLNNSDPSFSDIFEIKLTRLDQGTVEQNLDHPLLKSSE